MAESGIKRVGFTLAVLAVLLLALSQIPLLSRTDAPQVRQITGTPWAYLPYLDLQPTSTSTATPTFTPSPPDVKIVDVRNDAPFLFPIEKEYVVLENQGGSSQNMANWQLADAASGGKTYVFPTFSLAPGAQVNVWSKRGTDTATDLYWGRTLPVWNDSGDTAYLRNSSGQLVSSFSY